MKFIETTIRYFFYITTAILMLCAFMYGTSDVEEISVDILLGIVISGAVTALITSIFVVVQESGNINMILSMILHYIALCVVMIVMGERLGWVKYEVGQVVNMCIDVAIVYAITFIFGYKMDQKDAEDINKKLKEKYKDE